MTGIAGCCARAASGQAAALPSPAMNSRRRICDLPRWIRGAYPGRGCGGTGYVEACRWLVIKKGLFAAPHMSESGPPRKRTCALQHAGPGLSRKGTRSVVGPSWFHAFLARMSASHRCQPLCMAASDRALPSSVMAPVLHPPWNRHRALPGTGQLRQNPDRWRTRAPHRCLSLPC